MVILWTGAELLCRAATRAFFGGDDGAFALVAGDDDFDRFFQVLLVDFVAAHAHGAQGGFVDDVGQFGAGRAGRGAGDGVQVDVVFHAYIFGVYFEDGFTAFQVRQFDRDAAVETAGTEQCLIQGFGAVRGGENDDAFAAVETVHFGEQLVQGLFPFVVAAEGTGITFFADGVDFIDEDDARRLFLGLVEKVAHTGGAHADEHFDEFRPGNAEEGDLGFAGDGFGEQGLAGARRADQQGAFRHGGADLLVFVRMVQEIDQLDEGFFCLVLARYIGKGNAGVGLHVHFGIALAEVAHAADTAEAAFTGHKAHDELPDDEEDQDREDPVREEALEGRGFAGNDLREGDLALFEARQELRVFGTARDVDLFVVRVGGGGGQPFVADFDLGELALIHHLQECAVGDVFHLGLEHGREHVGVQQHDDDEGQNIVKNQRPPAVVAAVPVVLIIHPLPPCIRTRPGRGQFCFRPLGAVTLFLILNLQLMCSKGKAWNNCEKRKNYVYLCSSG